MTRHATGTFQVAVTPQGEADAANGIGLSRLGIAKTFSGDLAGTGTATMLAGDVQPNGVGVYVALERVSGTLDGKTGAFLFAHQGVMSADGMSLSITIVPGSGVGDLEGIDGELTLVIDADGTHNYDLAYTLP